MSFIFSFRKHRIFLIIVAEKEESELLGWLSRSNFQSRHETICSERVAGTGEWIVDDNRYKNWRSAEPKSRMLCCSGEPGAGKTYFASFVITVLQRDLVNEQGLAYVYGDYRDGQQSTKSLIAAIVRQLVVQMKTIPSKVFEIYNRGRRQESEVSLSDAEDMLRIACKSFTKVYICIDALDELKEGGKLLESLERDMPSSVRLFVTGRDHITVSIKKHFNNPIMLQLKAHENDIRNLIKNRIKKSREEDGGDDSVMDSDLEKEITDKIVSWSTGK